MCACQAHIVFKKLPDTFVESLLFSFHPYCAAEHATVSKNLNPRVGSMIVQSLMLNVLLLEEAAAERTPGTFFPKGHCFRSNWQ